ncbi:MAG: hypothetical protein LBD86_03560 [Spirochaetaceae bacterium]|jgi:hypothetical protein|nr:hypothetical protein [Spirochaetaceae bacterium]
MYKSKKLSRLLAVAVACMSVSCSEPVISQSYRIIFPDLPESWLEILGEASWHTEWVGKDGFLKSAESPPGGKVYVGVRQEWASPVSAWPYWPDKGIRQGVMKPAGAIFPLDVSGSSIRLTWNGGVDAVFFMELATLNSEKRLPHNFNWPRFRELFSGAALPEEILSDPWLADWKTIAAKTAVSGFDSRRISGQKRTSVNLEAPASGPWIGASPFMHTGDWQKDESITLKVSEGVDSYFCPEGVLRCSPGAWVWIKYS